MKRIKLTQGKFAIVDDEDFASLNELKWFAHKAANGHWYACNSNLGKRTIMHRKIMSAPPDLHVDHKDNNGLNNQKSNLRLCNHAQNQYNRWKPKRRTSSRYKGVNRIRCAKPWLSKIRAGGDVFYLGCFLSEKSAARAYDVMALKLHGKFARTNFKQVKK